MLKNNVNDIFFRKLFCQWLRKCKIGKSAIMLLPLHMIPKNNEFGVGGNVKLFTEANFILMNTKITTLNQKIIF